MFKKDMLTTNTHAFKFDARKKNHIHVFVSKSKHNYKNRRQKLKSNCRWHSIFISKIFSCIKMVQTSMKYLLVDYGVTKDFSNKLSSIKDIVVNSFLLVMIFPLLIQM